MCISEAFALTNAQELIIAESTDATSIYLSTVTETAYAINGSRTAITATTSTLAAAANTPSYPVTVPMITRASTMTVAVATTITAPARAKTSNTPVGATKPGAESTTPSERGSTIDITSLPGDGTSIVANGGKPSSDEGGPMITVVHTSIPTGPSPDTTPEQPTKPTRHSCVNQCEENDDCPVLDSSSLYPIHESCVKPIDDCSYCS